MEYVTLQLHYIELSFIVHNLLFFLWYHTVILLGNHFSFEQSVLCSGQFAIFVTPMPLHWRHKTLNYVLQLIYYCKKRNKLEKICCLFLSASTSNWHIRDFCSSDEIEHHQYDNLMPSIDRPAEYSSGNIQKVHFNVDSW